MSLDKLKRVLWRLRSNNKNTQFITNNELKRAVMRECGVHIRTYRDNRKSLVDLGWIKSVGSKRIRLTDEDLRES